MVYFQIDLNPIHQHHNQSNLINIGEEREKKIEIEIEKVREREREREREGEGEGEREIISEREREIISEMNGDVRQFNIAVSVRTRSRIIIVYFQLNTIPMN